MKPFSLEVLLGILVYFAVVYFIARWVTRKFMSNNSVKQRSAVEGIIGAISVFLLYVVGLHLGY